MLAVEFAPRSGTCEPRAMSTDGPPIPPSQPLRFVVRENERGEQTLDLVEGTYEQVYRLGDEHSTSLFLALSRSKGLLPYRRPRQHDGTICVRATLTEHDALWSAFLTLDRQLGAELAEVTRRFLRAHVPPKAG